MCTRDLTYSWFDLGCNRAVDIANKIAISGESHPVITCSKITPEQGVKYIQNQQ